MEGQVGSSWTTANQGGWCSVGVVCVRRKRQGLLSQLQENFSTQNMQVGFEASKPGKRIFHFLHYERSPMCDSML